MASESARLLRPIAGDPAPIVARRRQDTTDRHPERMNGSPNDVAVLPLYGLSRRTFVVVLPAVVALVAFVLGASAGGDILDRGMLPLVRFLALVKLAVGFSAGVGASLYCSRSQRRWLTGQAGAGCMSLGAGFLWSASAFGAGFVFFVTGALVCGLLAAKELERRGRRRPAS